MIGLAIDFSKRSKLIDDEIDQISLSSEEDMKDNDEHKLEQEIYNKESIRINELYNNEENDESMNKYFGTKNELSEVKIIPNPFTIEDNYNFVCAGHVLNKSFERKFIISADSTIGTLDLDNIIFNENKIPIGYIDDVLPMRLTRKLMMTKKNSQMMMKKEAKRRRVKNIIMVIIKRLILINQRTI